MEPGARSLKLTYEDYLYFPEDGKRHELIDGEQVNELSELAVPPGNRLERPKGDRAGEYSIRINDQYRVCFRWKDDYAEEVEITDYH